MQEIFSSYVDIILARYDTSEKQLETRGEIK